MAGEIAHPPSDSGRGIVVRSAGAAVPAIACPAPPSATAAVELLRGEPGSLGHLLATLAGRAAILGAGMAVGGAREHLVGKGLAAAGAIEVAVLVELLAKNAHLVPPGACLPFATADAIARLLRGDATALPQVLADVGGRTVVIAVGLWLFGYDERLWTDAFWGSLFVEAFLVAWVLSNQPGAVSATLGQAAAPAAALPAPR